MEHKQINASNDCQSSRNDVAIIRAIDADRDQLREIMVASKASWNYPKEWIEPWAKQVEVKPEFIQENEVYKAVRDGEIVGWYSLFLQGKKAVLDDLWVIPQAMGKGVGRRLFEHARQQALAFGAQEIEIASDPNAVGFYERMGALPGTAAASKALCVGSAAPGRWSPIRCGQENLAPIPCAACAAKCTRLCSASPTTMRTSSSTRSSPA